MILRKKYNAQIDIWALGCIFYFLLTGEHLFVYKNEFNYISDLSNIIDINERIEYKGIYLKNKNEKTLKDLFHKKSIDKSKDIFDLLKSMLTFDFNDRINIKDILNHKYLKL
jgi:serine/threonine protein kinase